MRAKILYFTKFHFCLLFFAFLALVAGCKSGPKIEHFLLGSWRSYQMKIHSILTFHANGNWVIENRVEGKLSKIVAKKGRITGEWFYTDDIEGLLPEGYEPPEENEAAKRTNVKEGDKDGEGVEKKEGEEEDVEEKKKIYLVLTVLSSEESEYWTVGATNPFEIVQLDKSQLILKDLNGNIMDWDRVRAEKGKEEGQDGQIVINMGSMVVNLSRTKIRHKRRYLCLDVDIILEFPVQEGMIMPEPPPLHPRIREAAIFYLSSLTYKDIKEISDAQDRMNDLKDILNPYMKGKIKELYIKNIIVTANKQNVEDFKNQILKPQEVEETEKKEAANSKETKT